MIPKFRTVCKGKCSAFVEYQVGVQRSLVQAQRVFISFLQAWCIKRNVMLVQLCHKELHL
jgi:hypothetical protein